MTEPRDNGAIADPVRQAEQILATSAHRLRRRERIVTLLWAFLPFPLLSALLGGGIAIVVDYCQRLVQDLHHDRFVSALDVLIPGLLITLAGLSLLCCGYRILDGLAHLLRHGSAERLAQYWRDLADRSLN